MKESLCDLSDLWEKASNIGRRMEVPLWSRTRTRHFTGLPMRQPFSSA